MKLRWKGLTVRNTQAHMSFLFDIDYWSQYLSTFYSTSLVLLLKMSLASISKVVSLH